MNPHGLRLALLVSVLMWSLIALTTWNVVNAWVN
jgi:hypothetical protein